MDRLQTFINNYGVIVLIIAIIEIVLIIALIVYVFKLKLLNDNKKYDENNDDEQNWKKSYNRKEKDFNNLKSAIISAGFEIKATNYGYQICQKRNASVIVHERTSISNFSHEDWAKQQREMRNTNKGTSNESQTYKEKKDVDSQGEVPVGDTDSLRYEYLESANSGQFRRLLSSDEKCFFRTWEDNGIRKFEFHGNVDRALANINAIFDETCEIEGKQNGATNIINVEPGILDSKLKVETKAKIKLI